jgi:FkbM family methyltransferase
MNLSHRVRRLYHYKLKTIFELAYRREFGYLVGILTKKAIGRNVYLEFLRRRGHDLLVEREVMGHTMTVDLADPGLSRYLMVRRVNEPGATPVFVEALQSAVEDHRSGEPTVLDIGANIGYFALLEAAVVGDDGAVYAFEPALENRQLLERNIEQNGYEGLVRVRPWAIGDSDGSAELELSDHSNWHRIVEEPDDAADTVTVETRRVDSILTEEDAPPESVVGVRMDVEGYESAIFEGMEPILEARCPLVLFVEIHPFRLTEDELARMLSRVRDAGFTVRFAGQDRRTFDVDSPDEIRDIDGSHVRLVLTRRPAEQE